MPEPSSDSADSPDAHPAIVGDVVFGGAASPVAICTLGSRALLPALAGRPEIAVAGRVFTENVGVERMIQNLAAFASVRYLIVCGRETSHGVGQTILALHRHGLDAQGRVIGSDAPEPAVVVDVIDDGPGIPAELSDRIFNPFFTTKTTGSGLGLPIVRKIVDAHDGRLDLSSGPAKGTRFRVTLPVSSKSSWFK